MIVDLVLYLISFLPHIKPVASLQIASIQIRLIALVSTFLKSVHY